MNILLPPNNRVAITTSKSLGIKLDSAGHYGATLKLPAAGSGPVTIFGAMASGYGPISILPNFILTDGSASPTSKPVVIPSTAPSFKPTAPSALPSLPKPTVFPTGKPFAPSVKPAISTTAPQRPSAHAAPAAPAASAAPTNWGGEDDDGEDWMNQPPIGVSPTAASPTFNPTVGVTANPPFNPSVAPTSYPTINAFPDLWSSQGRDIQNTRHVSSSAINSKTLNLQTNAHNFNVGASVSATPGVFGPYLVFPAYNGYIYCYDKTSSTLLWSYDIKSQYFP